MNSQSTIPDKAFYIDAVKTNSAMLASAARLGLRPPVPTCPGWYVATLVAHIGEVQHFWALQIRARATEAQALPRSTFDACPGLYDWFEPTERGETDLENIPDGLIEWFEAATGELVAAFENIGPDEAVWHWSGDNRALAHFRNQAIEACVHRWDAQNAHDAATPIDRALAVDGIDQHFEVQVPFARTMGASRRGSGETFKLIQSDGDRTWLVRFLGDEIAILEGDQRDPDVTVEGSAEALFLWLWGRQSPNYLSVAGNQSLVREYAEWWAYPKE